MLTPTDFDAMVAKIAAFHTRPAPGIVIGVAMVDYARDTLGPVPGKINAVCETQACLTDVIQVMTGCTMGNRYLRIIHGLGRYALTLYDRDTGVGVRVACRQELIDPATSPELYRWFSRTRGPELQNDPAARRRSGEQVMHEFKQVGRAVLEAQWVRVRDYGKKPLAAANVCTTCGESYLVDQDDTGQCRSCATRQVYFEPMPAPHPRES